jgi:hypothetical protein
LDAAYSSIAEGGAVEAPGNHQEVFAARTSPERTVRLDLAYAAGLYDYLKAEAARALTLRLFNMLAPSGTLFIEIFLTGIPDAGFMEAAMDWWLICRGEEQIWHSCPVSPTRTSFQYSNIVTPIATLPFSKCGGIDGWLTCQQKAVTWLIKRPA